MTIPRVLAAALFAALCTTSFSRAADADYLMPTGPGGGQPDDGLQPFDPNPAADGSRTRQFLTYGKDADGNAIPLKTLRITNNTTQTVYPIMRDPNSNVLDSNPAVGLYDPYDPPNKEYRGYIGYKENGKYYFGLKPGQSILVPLPLVFWNGARIGIGTDGRYLISTNPNPLRYDPNAFRTIADALQSPDTISNGVVMWYRSETSQAPNEDTEDQLAEWTIRDHTYLVNPQITARTNNEIPDNQLVTLINYDVSNVDSLYLPLAMAAEDVWVIPQGAGTGPTPNRSGWTPGSHPDAFGWTGAINPIEFLQSHIREFTKETNNALLGRYFNGKGWPFYNLPNPTHDPEAPIKIPSGANVFAQSPLYNTLTSYQDPDDWRSFKYMLSSGGTGPIFANVGGSATADAAGSTVLHLNRDGYPEQFAFIQPGFGVEGHPPEDPPTPNPIQAGTKVLSVNAADGTVTLNKPLVASSANCSFTFSRPASDYAVEAMIRLWYSWASYYRQHWRELNPAAPNAPVSITASISLHTATLTFNEPHPELVEGMAVTGPALDDVQTEVGKHQGNAVILEISSDKKSVILSQVADRNSVNETYQFHPPQELLWTPKSEADPGYPLFELDFSQDTLPAWHNPLEFSREVYLVMASMNQIGLPNNNTVMKFMQDIVGANMGFIFTNEAKKTDDAQMVIAMIRDKIKSVLRGVSDFTKYPDELDAEGNHIAWYPDPALHRGGRDFNVFNLDPFVWFVHVQLKFSGYGFSVDDDTADIGAGGASHLQLSIAGPGGLLNTAPWTIQAPYGPVKDVTAYYSGPASDNNGDTLYNAISNISETTPIRVTTPSPHHLANGDVIRIDQVAGPAGTNANGTFRIGNVGKTTFDLFDAATGSIPIASSGAYTGGGRWSYPLHPYIDTIGASMPGHNLTTVFYRVTGDDALGTFLGTFVSVKGVDRNRNSGERFRVWQLGRQDVGRLLLASDLTDAEGNLLPAGLYTFTFFGATEDAPPGPTPTPTPKPTPDYGPTVNKARRSLQEISKGIRNARRTLSGPERKQSIQEFKFCRKVARSVIATPSNAQMVQLLNQSMNATGIKNANRRANKFKRLEQRFRKIR